MILRNSARCLVCRQEIASIGVLEVVCSCGNLSVDGGLDMLIRSYWLPNSFEDTAVVRADDDVPNEEVPVIPDDGGGHHH